MSDDTPPLVPPAPEPKPMPDDPDAWLASRLRTDGLLEHLGLTGQDLADTRSAIEAVLADEPRAATARSQVVAQAVRLSEVVGRFVYHSGILADKEESAFEVPGVAGHGWGVLALCALVAAVPEIRAYHAERGVSDEVSWESLADLGQQVRVHRETFDEFGIHTHGWLTTAWSRALYGLGRLQFNLSWYQPPAADEAHPVADPQPRWVWSTHIPGTGPLTPEATAASFARAAEFFPAHFPEFEVSEFFCASWLLDPRFARLDPASNTARFQALWQLDGPGVDADGDAVFFLWRRRGEVAVADLPTDSSLRRLVAGEMAAGRAWQVWRGLIPLG